MIVRLAEGAAGEEELCVLEFQGEITGELDGSKLGSIKVNEDKTVVIFVGQHKLEGRLVDLKAPLLVLEKNLELKNDCNERNLIIQGVAKKKIIFKHRAVACVNSEEF
jgi:hypothetical protein